MSLVLTTRLYANSSPLSNHTTNSWARLRQLPPRTPRPSPRLPRAFATLPPVLHRKYRGTSQAHHGTLVHLCSCPYPPRPKRWRWRTPLDPRTPYLCCSQRPSAQLPCLHPLPTLLSILPVLQHHFRRIEGFGKPSSHAQRQGAALRQF